MVFVKCKSCGSKIRPKNSFKYFVDGKTFYFCSNVCMSTFKEFLEDIKNKNLDISDNWSDLGIQFLEFNEYENALKCFDFHLKINPKDIDSLFYAGITSFYMDEFENSIEYYDRALKIEPQNELIWLNKGISLSKLNRCEEALDYFNKTIEINPKNARALLEGARMLDSQGYNNESLNYLDKALTFDPQNEEIWLYKGLLLYEMERDSEAKKCFEEIIKKDPKDFTALGTALKYLGSLQLNLKQYNEASECFSRLLEIDPLDDEVWVLKGDAYYELERNEDSVSAYVKALQINPENEQALRGIELSLFSLKKYEEAINYTNRALELDHSTDSVLFSYLIKSFSLYFLRRFEEAITYFDKLLISSSFKELSFFYKGSSLLFMNRFEESIPCFSEVTIINPNHEICYLEEGIALFYLGKKGEANDCFDKVLNINPRNIYGLCFKSMILINLGKINESLNLCKDIALIDPNFEIINEVPIKDFICRLQELTTEQVNKNSTPVGIYDEKETNQTKTTYLFKGDCLENNNVISFSKEITQYIVEKIFNDLADKIVDLLLQDNTSKIQSKTMTIEKQDLFSNSLYVKNELLEQNQRIILEEKQSFEKQLINLKDEYKNSNLEDFYSFFDKKMDEFINIQQKENKEDFEKNIKTARNFITDWNKLTDDTKEFLSTTECLYTALKDVNDYENRDYSLIVLGMCRSFENELHDKIFCRFIQYICINGVNIDSFESDLNPNAEKLFDAISNQKRKKEYKLTLGQMYNFLYCIRYEIDEKRQTKLVQSFYRYSKGRFNIKKIIDRKFLDDTDEICFYRNGSAHKDKLTVEKADKVRTKCYNLINNLLGSLEIDQ